MEHIVKQTIEKIETRGKRTLLISIVLIILILAFSVLTAMAASARSEFPDFDPDVFFSIIMQPDRLILTLLFLAGPALMLLGALVHVISGKGYNKHVLYKFLITERDSIVWIYEKLVKAKVYGVQVHQKKNMLFYNAQGKSMGLVLSPDELNKLNPIIGDFYPDAVLGWSQDIDDLYRKNPGCFLKNISELRFPDKG